MTNGIVCQDHVQIRFSRGADLTEILEIEQQSFEMPHTAKSLNRAMCQKDVITIVLELDHQVLGYAMYRLQKHCLKVERLAVARRFRRNGVATQILRRLIGKLATQRRRSVIMDVDEALLPCHLLLHKVGFFAWSVNRESGEYCFEYQI